MIIYTIIMHCLVSSHVLVFADAGGCVAGSDRGSESSAWIYIQCRFEFPGHALLYYVHVRGSLV